MAATHDVQANIFCDLDLQLLVIQTCILKYLSENHPSNNAAHISTEAFFV